jgi:hypothetical protein
LRKSLNVNLPVALVTSLPKLLLALLHWRSVKPGPGTWSVWTRASTFLTPSGLVKKEAPSSVIALRLTSANRTRSSTWLLIGPCSTASRLTTSSRLST